MTYLLDTQLLLWLSGLPGRLSPLAFSLIHDPQNAIYFSPISIFEVSVKTSAKRPDFRADPFVLERNLIQHGFQELQLRSEHAAMIMHLPPLRKDPSDRLLLAQAIVEGFTLLTTDRVLSRYPSHVRSVL